MQIYELHMVYAIALSLALGMIIGLEREWRERDYEGGRRPAGVRSFGLIGLSGGVAGVIGGTYAAFPSVGLAIVLGVMSIAYWRRSHGAGFMGVTTIFAAFIAFTCGVLTSMEHTIPATAAAIVTAFILGAKERLHGFIAKLDQKEIFAALQFLLIAGVILPLAPNKSFGPFDAINPFEIWLIVVLISGLSFLGYISARLLSPKRGIIGTALLGGFVSSTAITLAFARVGKHELNLQRTLSAGIVLASSIMFTRVLLLCGLVWSPLLKQLVAPLGAMIATSIMLSVFMLRRQSQTMLDEPPVSNPLELLPALFFAGLLATIMFASRWVEASYGAEGVFVVAFASGLADVDAITLSLSRFAKDGLAIDIAASAILLATITNTVVKLALVMIAGGRKMFRTVFMALSTTILVGIIAVGLT